MKDSISIMKRIIAIALAAVLLSGCTKNSTTKLNSETINEKLTDCDLTFGNVHFTKALNGADKQVTDSAGIVTFLAKPHADYFIDPNDGKLTQNNSAVLMTEVDNTKPFTFLAKMKPGFTPNGLYNAAALFVYANDSLYQKFCFEQDERGNHRVVTVRTVGTSDDNNHEVFNDIEFIYYKISSDAHTIASYYSLDGKEWQMVRLYENTYPACLYLGICSQAPQSEECISTFEELSLTTDNVGDFRIGE